MPHDKNLRPLVADALRKAGFEHFTLEQAMGIPAALLVLVADEFDEQDGPDAPEKHRKTSPSVIVRLSGGREFLIGWVGPECPVLDLRELKDISFESLGLPIDGQYGLYPFDKKHLRWLKSLLG